MLWGNSWHYNSFFFNILRKKNWGTKKLNIFSFTEEKWHVNTNYQGVIVFNSQNESARNSWFDLEIKYLTQLSLLLHKRIVHNYFFGGNDGDSKRVAPLWQSQDS